MALVEPTEAYTLKWTDPFGADHYENFAPGTPFEAAAQMVEELQSKAKAAFAVAGPEEEALLQWQPGHEPPLPPGTELTPAFSAAAPPPLEPGRAESGAYLLPESPQEERDRRQAANVEVYTKMHAMQLAKFWWENIKDKEGGVDDPELLGAERKLEGFLPEGGAAGFWGTMIPAIGLTNAIVKSRATEADRRGISLGDAGGLDAPMHKPFYFPRELAQALPGADALGRYKSPPGETFDEFFGRFSQSPEYEGFKTGVRTQVVEKAQTLERQGRGGVAGRLGTFAGGPAGIALQTYAVGDEMAFGLQKGLEGVGVPPMAARILTRGPVVSAEVMGAQLVGFKETIEERYGLNLEPLNPLKEVDFRILEIKKQFPLMPDQVAEDLALAGAKFGVNQVVEFAAQNSELQKGRFEDILLKGPGLKEYARTGNIPGMAWTAVAAPIKAAVGFGLNAARDGGDVVIGLLEIAKLAPGFTAVNNKVRRSLEQKYGAIGDDPLLNFYTGVLSAAAEKGMLVDAPIGFLRSFSEDPVGTYATQPLSTLIMFKPLLNTLARAGNAYLRSQSMKLAGVLIELDLHREGMPLNALTPEAARILKEAGINSQEYGSYVESVEGAIRYTEGVSPLDYIVGDSPRMKAALSWMLNDETLAAISEGIGSERFVALAPETPLFSGKAKISAALAPLAAVSWADPVIMGQVATGTSGLMAAPLAAMAFPKLPTWIRARGENGIQVNGAQELGLVVPQLLVSMFDDVGRAAGEKIGSPEYQLIRNLVDEYYALTDRTESLHTFIKDRVLNDAQLKESLGEASLTETVMSFGQLMQMLDQTVGDTATRVPALREAVATFRGAQNDLLMLDTMTPEGWKALLENSDKSPTEVLEQARDNVNAATMDLMDTAANTIFEHMGDSDAVLLPETWGPVAARNYEVQQHRRLTGRLDHKAETLTSEFETKSEKIDQAAATATEKSPTKTERAAKTQFKESPEFEVWHEQNKGARRERGNHRAAVTRLEKKMAENKKKFDKRDVQPPEVQAAEAQKYQEKLAENQEKLAARQEQLAEADSRVAALERTRSHLLERYLNPEFDLQLIEKQRLADQIDLETQHREARNGIAEQQGVIDARFGENLHRISEAVQNDRIANVRMLWGGLADVALPQDTRHYVARRVDAMTPAEDGTFQRVKEHSTETPILEAERELQYQEADAAIRERLLHGRHTNAVAPMLARMAARRVANEGLGGFPLELLELDPVAFPARGVESATRRQLGGAGGGGVLTRIYTDLYTRVLTDDMSQVLLRSRDLRSRFLDYLEDKVTTDVSRNGLSRLVTDFASPRIDSATGIFYWNDMKFTRPFGRVAAEVGRTSGLEGTTMSQLFADFVGSLPNDLKIPLGFAEVTVPGKLASALGFVTKEGVIRQARVEAWQQLALEARVSAQSQGVFGYLARVSNSMPNLLFDNGFVDGAAGRSPSRYIANQVYDVVQNDLGQPRVMHGTGQEHTILIDRIKAGKEYSQNPQIMATILAEVAQLEAALKAARKAKSPEVKGLATALKERRAEVAKGGRDLKSFENYMMAVERVWHQQEANRPAGVGGEPGVFDPTYWSGAALESFVEGLGRHGYVEAARASIRLKSDIGQNKDQAVSEGAGLARYKLPVQFEFMPGYADMWKAFGVDPANVYIRKDLAGGEPGSVMFWLTFNQAISQHGGTGGIVRKITGTLKKYFTGLNPGSIATQWLSNPFTESAYTGELAPVALARVLKTSLNDYPAWSKDATSVPADVAFTFEQAREANLLNLDFYTQEVLVQMESLQDVPATRATLEWINAIRNRHGKRKYTDMAEFVNRWRQRIERGLQRGFQFSDQSHRLHRFKESHIDMLEQERMLNAGDVAFYTDVRHGRSLGSARKMADGSWTVRTTSGKSLTGRAAVLKMNEMRRQASRDHANSLYVDFRDKMGIQYLLSATGEIFTANFPTWRVAALDIPGVKRGLLANTFSPRAYFATTNALAMRRQIAANMGRDMRRAGLATAGHTADPDRDELQEQTRDFDQAGALFMHGSEGHFLRGAGFVYYSGFLGLMRDIHELHSSFENAGMLESERAALKKTGVQPPSYVIPLARELGLGEGLVTDMLSEITRTNRIANESGTLSKFSRGIIKNVLPQYQGRLLRALGIAALGASGAEEQEGAVGTAVDWLLDTVEPIASHLTDYEGKVQRSESERVDIAAGMAATIFNTRMARLPLEKRLRAMRYYAKETNKSIQNRVKRDLIERSPLYFDDNGKFKSDRQKRLFNEKLEEEVAFEVAVKLRFAEQLGKINIPGWGKKIRDAKTQASEDWGEYIPLGDGAP